MITSLARVEGPTLPDDKDRQRLRERLKDVEKRLQTHQPVALKWKEAGKLLMVVLEDQTILRFRVTDVRGLSDIKSIKIDQSVAEQSQERFLSADIDVTCQLMVASTQSGRLLLYDARKYDMGAEADHLGASGTCLLDAQTGSPVSLPGPASRVRINCSSDLVLAQCGTNLVIIHVTCGPPGRKGSKAVRQIYLSPEEAEKARAPTTTDEVISCHFSRHLPNRILVVQRRRAEGGALEFVACVFEYREAERQLNLVTSSSVSDLDSNVTAVSWSPREDQVALGTRDGALVVHDLGRGTLRTFQGSGRGGVDLLRWHPDGAVIAAAFGNGELLAFDNALQRVDFASDLRPSLDSVDLSGLHGFKCHVELFEWAVAPAKPAQSPPSPTYLHAALVMERGPVNVLRFPVGSADGRLRARDVVGHYLEDGLPEKALEVAEVLLDPLERYHCLLQVFPFLLRHPLKPGATHPLLDRASETIGSLQWEGLSLQQERTLKGLVRRYGQKLIRGGCAERAFRLARSLDDDALLADVLVWAVRKEEAPLAAAVQRLIGQSETTGRSSTGDRYGALRDLPKPSEFRALNDF